MRHRVEKLGLLHCEHGWKAVMVIPAAREPRHRLNWSCKHASPLSSSWQVSLFTQQNLLCACSCQEPGTVSCTEPGKTHVNRRVNTLGTNISCLTGFLEQFYTDNLD